MYVQILLNRQHKFQSHVIALILLVHPIQIKQLGSLFKENAHVLLIAMQMHIAQYMVVIVHFLI